MKTIKIIDLLNKIAVGEKVPKQINYQKQDWRYNPTNDYEGLDWGGCLLNNVTLDHLNDEVEILSDEDEFEDITSWGKPALEELKTKDIKPRDLQSYIYLTALIQNNIIKNQKKIIERLNSK